MSVFVISDLHLSTNNATKAMDVFGARWRDYHKKIEENWKSIVSDEDTVIIPGDISWAMTLDDAVDDFKLLNSLPGTKIIGKGNHDFWWATASKMYRFFEQNNFNTLRILYNNSFVADGIALCGSRGWFSEENNQKTVGEVDWKKIVDRETARLKISLESVTKEHSDLPKLVFLHFPPVWNSSVSEDIIALMHEHNVTKCYYGHIHGVYTSDAVFEYEGIRFEMISADYLGFCPRKVTM